MTHGNKKKDALVIIIRKRNEKDILRSHFHQADWQKPKRLIKSLSGRIPYAPQQAYPSPTLPQPHHTLPPC